MVFLVGGGLQVIYWRVLLDFVAWFGLSYSIWTTPNLKNAVALVATAALMFGTSGPTSRWTVTFPMVPILVLQGLRRRVTKLRDSKMIFILSLVLLLLSVVASTLFPPLTLPPVQSGGSYSVGAASFFLPILDVNNETCDMFNHTHIQVRLLYPKNGNDTSNRMPYLSPSLAVEFLRESMKAAAPPLLKPYDWLMHHWLLTELPIQRHADILPRSEIEKFPIVVYSHGLMGSADLYSYQAMSLASQGMLVLMVYHLDGSAPVAEHHDGSLVKFDYDIVQLWHDGKKEAYTRERRARTEWRAKELLGATDSFLSLNMGGELLRSALPPNLKLAGRIDTNKVFFMGHSFGGATVLTAAYRRPDLVKQGGIVAHEPAVDWLPDDARRSLLPPNRLEGLKSAHNYTGGLGGFEHHKSLPDGESSSLHDLSLLFLFSDQWRRQNWGESHILEEMHENGRLGAAEGVSTFGVVHASHHQEFSDMCMITPLWLARGTGATGTRNPLETAREIENRTWNFVSSVLSTSSTS